MDSQELRVEDVIASVDEELAHLFGEACEGNRPDALWNLLCNEIEKEDLDFKTKSDCIKLAVVLLQNDQWPNAEWTFYLFDVLLALYQIVTEGDSTGQIQDDLLSIGVQLSSLMSLIASVLQGEFVRMQNTPIEKARPAKFLYWFTRSIDIIVQQNFGQLTLIGQRGIFEFIYGVCRCMSFYDCDDLIPSGADIATAINRFCDSPFFHAGNQAHVSLLLNSFVRLVAKLSSVAEDDKFYYWLERYMNGDLNDAEFRDASLSLLVDAIPLNNDIVSRLRQTLWNAIAGLRGLTVRREYADHIGPVINRLIRRLVAYIDKNGQNSETSIRCCFENAASLFDYYQCDGTVALKKWLRRSQAYIIPALMLSPSTASSSILKEIARLCGTNRQALIMQNICHILVKLALNNIGPNQSKAIVAFIESEGATMMINGQENKLSFNLYIATNQFTCVYELLMHLALNKGSVIRSILEISNLINNSRANNSSEDGMKELLEFLRSRLVGILLKFTSKFISTYFPINEKVLTLRSLTCLMEICAGDILSEVNATTISTLRAASAVDDDRMKPVLATAWNVFLNSISLPTLESAALPIFVSITPLLSTQLAGEINETLGSLLKFIFRDQRQYLKDQLADIGYLSKAVSSPLLEAYSPAFDDSNCSFKDLLNTGLRLLTHEHPETKRLTLERLKSLLRQQPADVLKLTLKSDNADDVICQLSSTLTATLQHSDINVRRLAAICLGHLGAVDPGRLRTDEMPAVQQMYLDCENEQSHEFPCALLREVTRLLLGSSGSHFVYDVCSWALQEMLTIYGCRDEKKCPLANAIWSSLDEPTRKVLTPFLTSLYKVDVFQADNNRQTMEPLFGSSSGKNFGHWLMAWITLLISQLIDSKAKMLFTVLKEVARLDSNFAQFILPHVVLRRLLEGSDQEHEQVLKEMLAAMMGINGLGEPINDIPFERCAAHVVFCILDFLYKWSLKINDSSKSASSLAIIESFLNAIPKDMASKRADVFDAFPRSLMYYENYVENVIAKRKDQPYDRYVGTFMDAVNNADSDTCASLRQLQELYAKLDDVDGVVGAAAVLKRSGQTADKEQALAWEATGNYTEAVPFREAAASAEHSSNDEHINSHLRLVNCLLRLNQTGVCDKYLSDLSVNSPDQQNELHAYRVEALLKLQQWDGLKQELERHSDVPHSWPSDVGKLLVAAREKNVDVFNQNMQSARDNVLEKLSVAVRDSGTFDGGYGYKLRLHMLSEIEQSAERLFDGNPLEGMLPEWEERSKIVQPSIHSLFALLDQRKQILGLGPASEKSAKAIGSCWLEAAKIARKAGYYQSAWSLLVKAKKFQLIDTFMEEAKLLWNKDEKIDAVSCLRLGLRQYYYPALISDGDSKCETDPERRLSFAKAMLLFANYSRESGVEDSNNITRMYNKVVAMKPDWEEAHYYFALHLENYAKVNTSMHTCINFMDAYVRSLVYGSRFVHHSMPRLITMWLDQCQQHFYERKRKAADAAAVRMHTYNIQQLNNVMERAHSRIPTYQFYCCFSQLISRIIHPDEVVYQTLKKILASLISKYPRQCVWMTVSASRSSFAQRSGRCKEIIQAARDMNSDIDPIFASVDKLTDLLIGVCEKTVESNAGHALSMKRDFKQLFEFRSGENVILPLQKFMDITYPGPSFNGASTMDHHKPFNDQPVYIDRFLDAIEVFMTLQKPKKISLRGSDGQTYSMMCKARDDLRLDKRLMEFTNLVNTCMLRDPEARRRKLHIRTYTVTPLSEKCGLLEWVPNLDSMRNVYQRMCREYGKKIPAAVELRNYHLKSTETFEKKWAIFNNELLPKHPSLLKNWFPRTFPDPVAWYTARTNFVRTAAVMSMVGFVLGLGDRHGENILLDRTCGDVVHVDFNCLFNRGEQLEVPEVIPFRLTRNMVDAMGPIGYEGQFRKACEVTMKLMRNEFTMLTTVLETFLHDPLVEWQQSRKSNSPGRPDAKPRPESGEEKAQRHLMNIKLRLRGSVKPSLKEDYGFPLSVEGQVKMLIDQATDNRLLAQMYIGWGPYF